MTETTCSANGRSEGKSSTPKRARLSIDRVFTSGVHPYEEVTWERRTLCRPIGRPARSSLSKRALNSPDFWSVNAHRSSTRNTSVEHSVPRPEQSLQLIDRVVKTYRKAGRTSDISPTPIQLRCSSMN